MESKSDLMARLRAEERWDEASQFREQARQRLREEGKTRKDARDEAWQLMAEQFPPLPDVETGAAEDAAFEPLLEPRDGGDVNLVSDILWVYDNIENKQAAPESAPSLGAWSLLKWARKYQMQFFDKLLHRALAAKQTQPDEKEKITHSRAPLDQCERLLSEIADPYRITCPDCGCEYQHYVPESADTTA